MKYKTLASILLLLPTFVIAENNAVLDVAGEIQINGKTVINNEGKFIGGERFKKSDYFMSGEYHYRRVIGNELIETTIIAEENTWKQTRVSTREYNEINHNVKNPDYDPNFDWNNSTLEEQNECNQNQCQHEYIWDEDGVKYVRKEIRTEKRNRTFSEEKISTYRLDFNQTYFNGTHQEDSDWKQEGTAELSIQMIHTSSNEIILGYVDNSQIAKITVSSIEILVSDDTFHSMYPKVGDSWVESEGFWYQTKLNTFTFNGKEYKNCLADGENIICPGIGIIYDEWYGSLVEFIPSNGKGIMPNQIH